MPKMALEEFQEKSTRSYADLSREDLLVNGVLGLIGEWGEWAEHPANRWEAGDVAFYFGMIANACGFKLSFIDSWEGGGGFCKLTEFAKKIKYHGKPLENYVAFIEEEVFELFAFYLSELDRMGWSLEEILWENYQKLLKRYPNGFTQIR